MRTRGPGGPVEHVEVTGERAQRVGVHDHGMRHLGDELPDQRLCLGVEREARAERHRVAAGEQAR